MRRASTCSWLTVQAEQLDAIMRTPGGGQGTRGCCPGSFGQQVASAGRAGCTMHHKADCDELPASPIDVLTHLLDIMPKDLICKRTNNTA